MYRMSDKPHNVNYLCAVNSTLCRGRSLNLQGIDKTRRRVCLHLKRRFIRRSRCSSIGIGIGIGFVITGTTIVCAVVGWLVGWLGLFVPTDRTCYANDVNVVSNSYRDSILLFCQKVIVLGGTTEDVKKIIATLVRALSERVIIIKDAFMEYCLLIQGIEHKFDDKS